MLLTDLKDRTNVANIKFRIFRKFDTRTVNIRGQDKQVTDMLIKDSGDNEGKLTIWGTDAKNFNENEVVELSDGWCKIWNEQVQLSKGRSGKFNFLGEDADLD